MWFRIASAGSGPERYTLQVPFQLAPTHTFKDLGEAEALRLDSLTVEVVENYGIHLLRVSGFWTEKEAMEYLPKLQGAVLRLTVVKRLSLRAATALQYPKLHDPPIEVKANSNFAGLVENVGWTHLDGFVDPAPSVVIPEHRRIMETGAGSAHVVLSMPAQHFLKELAQGLALPVELVAQNSHLSLAIDLYAASLWESSRRARVITLSTTLEALLLPELVSTQVERHLDNILREWDAGRDRSRESEAERSELDRLRSRLADLRNESISRRLRNMVVAHAADLSLDTAGAARRISHAYGVRSELLHEGRADEADVTEAAAWLNTSVPAILQARVNHLCGIEP